MKAKQVELTFIKSQIRGILLAILVCKSQQRFKSKCNFPYPNKRKGTKKKKHLFEHPLPRVYAWSFGSS